MRVGLHRMMRGVFGKLALVGCAGVIASVLGACGGSVQSSGKTDTTTQETYGVSTPAPAPKQSTRVDRLSQHDGTILPSVRLRLVYVGVPHVDQAPAEDEFVSWLITSDYWGTLAQYGVGPGTVLESVSVPRSVLAPPELVQADKGLIAIEDLDARVKTMVNGSATESPYPGVAGADAYVIFLPDGLNVATSHRADYTSTTCIDESGYHAHDGVEPYMVVPPCEKGRGTFGVSHELSEMVTDPVSAAGWVSDGDVSKNGGEIADLCNHSVMVENREVTQLWSNSDGECIPFKM
jgi:hypothetical protein